MRRAALSVLVLLAPLGACSQPAETSAAVHAAVPAPNSNETPTMRERAVFAAG